METALREVQARFKAVVENLDDGLVISDTEGNLLSWSPAALKMHGYSDSEECPFRLDQISKFFKVSTLDGAMLPIEEWPLARVLRGEEVRDVEVRLQRVGKERMRHLGGTLSIKSGPQGTILKAIFPIETQIHADRSNSHR